MTKKTLSEAINTCLGSSIRQARVRRGIPVAELAGRIGCSAEKMKNYERGLVHVSAGVAFVIAVELGCDIQELMQEAAGDDFGANSQQQASLARTRALIDLIAQKNLLPDAEQQLTDILKIVA